MYECDLDEVEKDLGQVVKDHGITVHACIVLLVMAVKLLISISRRMVRDGGEG